MIKEKYKHYIRTDMDERIIHGFSSAFAKPSDADICINTDGGYQFRLFPDGEENPSLKTPDGIPIYKWTGSEVIPRTPEEIEADRAALPKSPPTDHELIENLQSENNMLKECLLEMSSIVYA